MFNDAKPHSCLESLHINYNGSRYLVDFTLTQLKDRGKNMGQRQTETDRRHIKD
jgi:hypothetical protein